MTRVQRYCTLNTSCRRQKISATATCIPGTTPCEIRRQLAAWDGVVDEVIVRALPAQDMAAETLAILHAVKPS
jgi:hypothetical protein